METAICQRCHGDGPCIPCNRERAERARRAIAAWHDSRLHGEEDLATDAQDLITDLLHLVRIEMGEGAAEEADRLALANFQAEMCSDDESLAEVGQ